MSTATFSKTDLIRKISALLTTAESFAKDGNDEAAASYVSKAHELQQRHSIEQHLLTDKAARPQKIISKTINLPGPYGKRKAHLAHVVAMKTDCTGYYNRTYKSDAPKQYQYVIFGFEDDVEWAETLIISLCHQSNDALRYAAQDNLYEHGKTFGASFHAGFASEVGRRLTQAKREAEHQVATTQDTSSVSLVLIAKRQQVQEEMTARIGKLGKGTTTQNNSTNGYRAGRDAGSRATLARGAVSTSTRGSLQ